MKDKNELPLDMIYLIFTERNLYGANRKKFQARFGIEDYYKAQEKIEEFRSKLREDPEATLKKIAKSPRLVLKYIDRNRRLPESAEKIFFEKTKGKPEYFHYCSKFGILVDNFEQVATEVALECEGTYHKKEYMNEIINQRKKCKSFLEQHVVQQGLSKLDSIQKLLESL